MLARVVWGLAMAGLLTGVTGCGGSPAGPDDQSLNPGTQYWAVAFAGTVVMADPPFAPLPGVTVSWFTCGLPHPRICTLPVVTDSLGHYSITASFIVHLCAPGKLEVFRYSPGLLVSLQGYESSSGEAVALTTDFCRDALLGRDFALRKLP